MGACLSSRKKKSSVMKVHTSSGSDRIPSPAEEKHHLIVNYGNVDVESLAQPTNNLRDFASKEETFFDSQAWLDSDCESDFMSVNGEFTPSRGNTPLHHVFLTGTPPIKGGLPVFPVGTSPLKVGGPVINDDKPSMTTPFHPSPTPIMKKKRLSEFFSESIRENHNSHEETEEPTIQNGAVRSLKEAKVHGGGSKSKRERWVGIMQVNSCLPRVLSSCRPVSTQQTEVRRK